MRKKNSDIIVPLVFIQEGDSIIAYSPAVELSTCGKTIDEAHKRFIEAFDIFVKETTRMGTLEEVLLEYGWTKVTTPGPGLMPPRVVGHLDEFVRLPLGA